MKILTDTVVPYDESLSSESSRSLHGTRRLIKVDFSALQMDDDDEDEDLEASDGEVPPKTNPWHRTGTAAVTHDQYHHYCDTALECTLPPQNAVRLIAGCQIL